MSPIYVPGKVVLKKDGVAATDTNIREVSLLLHGNGTNGSTTITDSSLTPKTVTAVGNAQISTAQSKFGGASIAFDGNGDYVTVPVNTAFEFGTGDFTIEGWINVPTTNATLRCIFSIGRPVQLYHTSGRIDAYFGDNDSGASYFVNPVSGPASLLSNTWTHFAVTRSGSIFRVFINGNAGTPVTGSAGVFFSATGAALGTFLPNPSTFPYTGYIDDLRITKGVARYTANFTPPTAPFPDF
jgi:hypothetical protein